VQNRYGENVIINIQGARLGIEIQGSFFKVKEGEKKKAQHPRYAFGIFTYGFATRVDKPFDF
jgi:hypothetical protein